MVLGTDGRKRRGERVATAFFPPLGFLEGKKKETTCKPVLCTDVITQRLGSEDVARIDPFFQISPAVGPLLCWLRWTIAQFWAAGSPSMIVLAGLLTLKRPPVKRLLMRDSRGWLQPIRLLSSSAKAVSGQLTSIRYPFSECCPAPKRETRSIICLFHGLNLSLCVWGLLGLYLFCQGLCLLEAGGPGLFEVGQ